MFDAPAPDGVLTRADLLASGIGPRAITTAVAGGTLLRLRRDRYTWSDEPGVGAAVRVGGRLACVSLLALFGAFVWDASRIHIHLDRTMSRLRSPDDRRRVLSAGDRTRVALHWWPLRTGAPTLGVIGLADALAQAVRCQAARASVATVDSVLHLGLLSWAEVQDVFDALPRRYRVILALADGIAESGPEFFMRLILRQLGVRYQAQVRIPTVGRVDFLVDGWLIIECDSRAHHEGWEKQKADRRRDLAAAARGMSTLRPLAEDLFHAPGAVRLAVRGMMSARRSRRS